MSTLTAEENDLEDGDVFENIWAEDNTEAALEKPVNHGPSPPFYSLIVQIFNTLTAQPGREIGRFASKNVKDRRKMILRRYIDMWRDRVGPDIYPCFRMLLPSIDKERLYGIKEVGLARLLIKILEISPDSPDANSILKFRLPGTHAQGAGDFAERCFQIMKKREAKPDYGKMTIDQVNETLEELSKHSKADDQLPVLKRFYENMNAEEMKWLIRIILRELRIGVSERLLFYLWHPDAVALYSISHSLKRVCWELCDPTVRLTKEESNITIMSCFQPQLAAFPKLSYERVVKMMDNDKNLPFFIEEKLDGERIQLHMSERGNKFKFYSRHAKDYTYMYGSSFDDPKGSLAKHLRGVFNEKVESIILDGEMVSWDTLYEMIEPFGTLKSSALADQDEPSQKSSHPLYRVFDILYVNGTPMVDFELEGRKRALKEWLTEVPTRFELHPFERATTQEEIEVRLRQVIEQSSEGLVIKNPTAVYTPNGRTDLWIKVKPEYMNEFGENLDVLVIGAYYGRGKRSNLMASYLCGLRVEDEDNQSPKFWSFCRVGGGFTAEEYRSIARITEGKWHGFDPKNVPSFFELAGSHKETPDLWIAPEDSIVLEVKASAVVPDSDKFRTNMTLRFPRFRRLRMDKNHETALSLKELLALKTQIESEKQERETEFENHRQTPKRKKRKLDILEAPKPATVSSSMQVSDLFKGHSFYLILDSRKRVKLEQEISANGGEILRDRPTVFERNWYIIADSNLIQTAPVKKEGKMPLVRSAWIHDCLFNERVLPFENRHLLFLAPPALGEFTERQMDCYNDSYMRQIEDITELQQILENIPEPQSTDDATDTLNLLIDSDEDALNIPSLIFFGTKIYFDFPEQATSSALPANSPFETAVRYARFGGAQIADTLTDEDVTHVVIISGADYSRKRLTEVNRLISSREKIPHVLSVNWIIDSWSASTRLSEELLVL
ncbi:putative DNA ligase [Myxozyma melibiosi]|uniref:DNA ligase n=1 Tax=Myxozyma melibiosi TaxID=54550 RepID=A0ABR1F3M2_9ASCO